MSSRVGARSITSIGVTLLDALVDEDTGASPEFMDAGTSRGAGRGANAAGFLASSASALSSALRSCFFAAGSALSLSSTEVRAWAAFGAGAGVSLGTGVAGVSDDDDDDACAGAGAGAGEDSAFDGVESTVSGATDVAASATASFGAGEEEVNRAMSSAFVPLTQGRVRRVGRCWR